MHSQAFPLISNPTPAGLLNGALIQYPDTLLLFVFILRRGGHQQCSLTIAAASRILSPRTYRPGNHMPCYPCHCYTRHQLREVRTLREAVPAGAEGLNRPGWFRSPACPTLTASSQSAVNSLRNLSQISSVLCMYQPASSRRCLPYIN